MGSDEGFNMRELEKLTGFSARSIHHYMSRGLLPRPEGKGPAARYGEEHVLRLKLIGHAEKAGFRIDQRLQEALDGVSLGEMQELVRMAEGAEPEQVRRFGEWLMTGDWRPQRGRVGQAPMLQQRMPAMAEMLQDADHGLFGAAVESMKVASMAPPPERAKGREISPQQSVRSAERWERVRIGGMFELAWRRPRDDPKFDYKVEEMIRRAEKLFGRYGSGHGRDHDGRDRGRAGLLPRGRDDPDKQK